MIRLDKYLADTGAASRREAKMYIRRGEVTVDGVPAAAPEQKVSETAVVCLRGQPLHYQTYHYYMLHKPSGVLTATSDRSQPTVLDLFPPELQRFGLVPAGRLDKDTTGLLLITDDGDYVHRVITPKKHVPKVYFARTDGMPTSADAERFADVGGVLFLGCQLAGGGVLQKLNSVEGVLGFEFLPDLPHHCAHVLDRQGKHLRQLVVSHRMTRREEDGFNCLFDLLRAAERFEHRFGLLFFFHNINLFLPVSFY